MNLIQKLKRRFKPEPMSAKSLLSPEQTQRLRAEAEAVLAPLPPAPPKPKGRVIKQTRSTEFNPDSSRQGGRIVRVMPRKLQQIKQAQELVENDDQPSVEDLED